MIRIAIDGKSDIGRKRDENEDAIYFSGDSTTPFSFIVIADGMGGYHGGATASRLAIEKISQRLLILQNQTFASCTPQQKPQVLKSEILHAINDANQTILDCKSGDNRLRQMGTTVVVAVIWEHSLVTAHVGDSRAYLWNRDYGLKQLTRDHSVVQNMIDSGALSESDARTSKVRNQLTKAVGVQASVEPVISEFDIAGDNLVLLCSDGMTEYFSNEDIEYVLSTHRPALECCYMFIDESNKMGGKDNISVAIAECLQPHEDMQHPADNNDEDKTVPYSV
ncbi:Stp1/IreP family PP2C-type Ser/Thr phosphatase [Sansalvadorimonas sp. 2012CJ34-2]|uniref:Stp1/IreP family PP2C-type Ser/Thr phosphatase n=1 Tax=Parendozoicomonas callyspongiae TaxID=2942213 RepID=A0ABT0PFP1_9GAMM|nr:Stp1/IreP family PP2C-type Ser/Thr phosphatase [Sansalvadorimonas sp. 2012CJ34-2]MCL6269353.1 Stp1/IreP family PP2C-type Ser/Thr phosphatase [Sansalvadorimonas sp. 2012CJ34-2]